MSFEALAWGVRQSPKNPISKLVLLMICNYANDKFISIRKEKNGAFGFNLYTLNMGYMTQSQLAHDRESDNTQDIQITSHFDEFWSKCPRKIGKKKVRTLYNNLIRKKEVTEQELIDGMTRYAESVKNTETAFIVHPSTFLAQGRWEDDLGVKQKNKNFLLG